MSLTGYLISKASQSISKKKKEMAAYSNSIEYSYLVFSIIYVFECVIKFLGLGPKKV